MIKKLVLGLLFLFCSSNLLAVTTSTYNVKTDELYFSTPTIRVFEKINFGAGTVKAGIKKDSDGLIYVATNTDTGPWIQISGLYFLDTSSSTQTKTGGIVLGGSLSLSPFTLGSIPFIGASGLFTQDNANLFWDNTNKRLGIGTAGPSQLLNVVSSANVNKYLIKAEASQISAVADYLNTAILGIANGLNISWGFAIGVVGQAKKLSSAGAIGLWGTLSNTTPVLGVTGMDTALYADGASLGCAGLFMNGNVGIGTTSPDQKLTVAGNISTTGQIISSGTADNYFAGYTQLGSDAPKIKMLKLSTTTASTEDGVASIPHGLTFTKIISITSLVNSQLGTMLAVPPELSIDTSAGYQYSLHAADVNVYMHNHPTNSENILSKSAIVTIIYEE